MTALTESALKGLVIRNAGSGAWPVRKRSGKAVISQALFFDRKSQRTAAKEAAG